MKPQDRIVSSMNTHTKFDVSTWAVQKVFVHSEYLENRWRDLDVTWQPVRGDITAHP